MPWIRGLLCWGLLLMGAVAVAQDGPLIVGRASVIDGDTIEIRGQSIRLWGIDTPESAQTCRDAAGQAQRVGQKASFALADLIGDRTVTCVARTKDRYGRIVASCSVDGEDLSRRMVADGWAWAFRRYSEDFVADEEAARSAQRNVWALQCMAPWDWRQRTAPAGAAEAPQ